MIEKIKGFIPVVLVTVGLVSVLRQVVLVTKTENGKSSGTDGY
ncbi:MAG: hypothetical protein WAZ38_03245 [Prolixibacteraceae bacterium]